MSAIPRAVRIENVSPAISALGSWAFMIESEWWGVVLPGELIVPYEWTLYTQGLNKLL